MIYATDNGHGLPQAPGALSRSTSAVSDLTGLDPDQRLSPSTLIASLTSTYKSNEGSMRSPGSGRSPFLSPEEGVSRAGTATEKGLTSPGSVPDDLGNSDCNSAVGLSAAPGLESLSESMPAVTSSIAPALAAGVQGSVPRRSAELGAPQDPAPSQAQQLPQQPRVLPSAGSGVEGGSGAASWVMPAAPLAWTHLHSLWSSPRQHSRDGTPPGEQGGTHLDDLLYASPDDIGDRAHSVSFCPRWAFGVRVHAHTQFFPAATTLSTC